MENKKGQIVWGYSLMLGITIIILALALAPAGKAIIDDARGNTTYINKTIEVWNESSMTSYEVNGTIENIGLDCDNPTISNFVKGTCDITDFGLFYFFGGLILIGGAVITARLVF